MENQESLVGPQIEDREKEMEDMTADGQPIWMAFLENPEALSISPDEAQTAKNAAETADPKILNNCRRVPIKECIDEVHRIAA